MAVMTDEERRRVHAQFMRVFRRFGLNSLPGNKADLRILVNAADDFADQHASTYNQMIPAAQRSLFDNDTKAAVLCAVILRRRLPELFRAEEDG